MTSASPSSDWSRSWSAMAMLARQSLKLCGVTNLPTNDDLFQMVEKSHAQIDIAVTDAMSAAKKISRQITITGRSNFLSLMRSLAYAKSVWSRYRFGANSRRFAVLVRPTGRPSPHLRQILDQGR